MLSELLKGQNLSAYAKELEDTLQGHTLDLPSPPTPMERVEARPKERAKGKVGERARSECSPHSRRSPRQ